MISKIANNSQKTFNFRANRKDNKINYRYEQLKANSAISNKITPISSTIGLIAGIGAKIANKNNDIAFNIGFASYLISDAILFNIYSKKNNKDLENLYEKYTQNLKYENKLDEFISKKSIPIAIDFGSEEKNKEYFDLAFTNNKKEYKNKLISIGGGILTAGIVGSACLLKNLSNKLNKTLWAGIFSTAGIMIAKDIKDYLARRNEKNSKNNI